MYFTNRISKYWGRKHQHQNTKYKKKEVYTIYAAGTTTAAATIP